MGKGNRKFSLEIHSNTTWEVREQGSFLDLNIKVSSIALQLKQGTRGGEKLKSLKARLPRDAP